MAKLSPSSADLNDMRVGQAMIVAVLAVPVALGGCGAKPAAPQATPEPVAGPGWLVSETGKATASPSASVRGGTRTPPLPPVSFLPVDPDCASSFPAAEVTIPMTVVPGKGSLTVTWPRQNTSNYRVAAIPQPLVSGTQATTAWQDVPAASGCTATATITGLTSGKPYVVWLDAPNSGAQPDGTRHPYSGRSGVVIPT